MKFGRVRLCLCNAFDPVFVGMMRMLPGGPTIPSKPSNPSRPASPFGPGGPIGPGSLN